MNLAKIAFRPATSEDRHWLWELKQATMREYVAAIYGWDDATQLRMFDQKFDPSRLRIIRVGERDAGLLECDERAADFFLARIEILPALQRTGVGSAVIGMIIAQAAAKRKVVRLQVLRSNPARQLYARLGFCVEGETATHILMKREPA